MTAVLAKAMADLRHHRVQAAAIALILLLASGTGVVALTLMSQAGNPYQQAFSSQAGADLEVWVDPSAVTPAELDASATAIGATAAGPFPYGGVAVQDGSTRLSLALLGRASPGGVVDRLHLVEGRWAGGGWEIVVPRSLAVLDHLSIGQRLSVVGAGTMPALTVVGEAVDIDQCEADLCGQTAWVAPSTFSALNGPSSGADELMLYRLPGRPTQSQLVTSEAALTRLLPAGAIFSTSSYLVVSAVYGLTSSLVGTMLLAFGAFALAVAALVAASAVAATVLSAYREIGVMKAVGFTPRQATLVHVVQMLVPALAGCVVGLPLGMWLSMPLLDQSTDAVGLPSTAGWPFWPAAIVLAAVVAIVGLASLVPARRAGRLRAVEALARGTSPGRGGPSRLAALLSRLHLPQTVVLGSRDAFARPLRGAIAVVAITAGVATAVFAAGLQTAVSSFGSELQGAAAPVEVWTNGPGSPAIEALIASQPGTAAVVGEFAVGATVPGIADTVNAYALQGDPAALSLRLVSGRWFAAPGEAVAPQALFNAAHLRLGGSVTVGTSLGRPLRLTLVGEIFSVQNFGESLDFDLQTLAAVEPGLQPDGYEVALKPGVDATAYAGHLQAADPHGISVSVNSGAPALVAVLTSVGWGLALILLTIAAAATLDAVLLTVRERRRDLATLKAMGSTPRQLVAMVASAALILGLAGGVIGVPIGLVLTRVLLTAFAAAAGNGLPPQALDALATWTIPVFVLGGMAAAVLGGLLPARSAARTPVATTLHDE